MHVPNLIYTWETERFEFFPSIPSLHLLLALTPSSMAPRQELSTSMAQGKHPVEPSQPVTCLKVHFDTILFSTLEEYQRYKQHFSQRRVVSRRNINFAQIQHFGFDGLFTNMGWLSAIMISKLVFLTLVGAFYSRVTYDIGGPITSTVRGVEIRLDLKSIFRIFDIASIGLRVYKSKMWPTMLIRAQLVSQLIRVQLVLLD